MRRSIIAVLTTLLVVAAIGAAAVAGGNGSTVTKARLERALPVVFANMYVQQARLLGRTDITAASLKPQAMCDKHGPDVADVGPGGDWICLMSWTDPQVPMPSEGYGKFELNVHSNDCFTAAGPSKLTGFLTMTDQHGREVTNPLFEFDGCFDPATDDTPTGTTFPSVFAITSPSVTPDAQGLVNAQVTCGTGSQGCAGTITAMAGKTSLGVVPYRLKEEATARIPFPNALPAGTKEISFQVTPATGYSSDSPVVLPVQER